MDRHDRLVVALIGAIYGAMATQLAPPYYLADLIDSAPLLWEAIFLAAGVACLALAITARVWLRFTAGALIMLAAGSRGVAVLVTSIVTPEVSYLPALGWTLVFVLQSIAWPVLAPRR